MKYLTMTLLLVGGIVFSVVLAWFLMKPEIKENVDEVVAPPQISPTPIAFVSAETGDSVFVTFGTSTALFNGVGYSNILLTQIEAASGAKYESLTENLVLWNKATEVTLMRGRKMLFVGQSGESLALTLPTATSSKETATSSENILGEWLWIETVKGDVTITPKKAGVFSVTFSDNNIRGTTDCNGFNGTYEKKGNTIKVGVLGTTKMFCEGSQEMEFTQQFIGTLTVIQPGNKLTLTHSDGTVSRFEAK
jgi:heat shock protein HslJ